LRLLNLERGYIVDTGSLAIIRIASSIYITFEIYTRNSSKTS
jgi:hypothetical protein